MNKYMELALKEANKANKNRDIPVGAVIVKNDKVIAKAHNLKIKKQIATSHAEMIAITKACKKLRSWRLNNCTLYVTLEPCDMCKGAIKESRIKETYYLIKTDYYKNKEIIDIKEIKGAKEEKLNYQHKLKKLFNSIRK